MTDINDELGLPKEILSRLGSMSRREVLAAISAVLA